MIQTKNCKCCNCLFDKPYNESKKNWINHQFCSKSCINKGRKHTEESKTKARSISLANKSIPPCRSGNKHYRWTGGIKKYYCTVCSNEISSRYSKRCMRCHKKETVGENSPNWQGGIYPENLKQRQTKEYKDWRTSVFKRDKYTCQECKITGGKLNADHIKPFAYYPELRLNIDNGKTLCISCHRKTDTYGNKHRDAKGRFTLIKGVTA